MPANFERVITASATPARRQNKVWADGNVNSRGSLVGEPYRCMTDPRVSYTRTTNTTLTGIPVVYQTKYPDASSPIPFATGDEAQFIVAEADLAAGNLTSAVTIINTFRARAGLPAFSSTTAAAIKTELVEQRRREFFLEGQHLGDLIRYSITPQPAVLDKDGEGTGFTWVQPNKLANEYQPPLIDLRPDGSGVRRLTEIAPIRVIQ